MDVLNYNVKTLSRYLSSGGKRIHFGYHFSCLVIGLIILLWTGILLVDDQNRGERI